MATEMVLDTITSQIDTFMKDSLPLIKKMEKVYKPAPTDSFIKVTGRKEKNKVMVF
jgi:hypothetical protein